MMSPSLLQITRRYRFPAAHVLASAKLSDEENLRVFGKCANPNGHGHNYGIEVTLRGPVDEATGQIVPIGELDAIFDETIRDRYSHKMLNDLPSFRGLVPTAENIAKVIHDELACAVSARGSARVARVRVVETERNHFDYGEMR